MPQGNAFLCHWKIYTLDKVNYESHLVHMCFKMTTRVLKTSDCWVQSHVSIVPDTWEEAKRGILLEP
jgi:hypothetical protein